jgi:hypothetical protein
VGGGMVSHDELCSYYEDIIENYEVGWSFLEGKLNYRTRIGSSVNLFGVSLSNVALLGLLGIEGLIVERMGDYFVGDGEMEMILKARSSNKIIYGAMVT